MLRLLDDGELPAAWNMALDEALLHRAQTPTLRLYGWQPHAVSLGYFQKRADFDDLPKGTDLTRRLTGGGAIHHGDELTFSLTIDAERLPRDIDPSYTLLHDAVVAALSDAGVASQRLDRGHAPSARPTERWCFAAGGRNDIVDLRGRKLVGSAQRRQRIDDQNRVLHHGSIVLCRASHTPFTAAVADAQPPRRAEAILRQSLPQRLAAVLNLQLHRDLRTAQEVALATQLREQKYSADSFLNAR